MRGTGIHSRILFALIMFVLACTNVGCTANSASDAGELPDVEVLEVPDSGIQPVVQVDRRGTAHMIYFTGDPAAGNIYYVHRKPGGDTFSAPVRVNSQPGSVIAAGTVRGAHLALGKDGRLHVAWMGSSKVRPKGPGEATPMLYTRSIEGKTAFEEQQNVMQHAHGLDGGGTVAADTKGNVYVLWHAGAGREGEENRRVWVARSSNGGRSFAREVAISPPSAGACGCCGMAAATDAVGRLYALFRGAETVDQRDVYLLASRESPAQPKARRLAEWSIDRCPMSTFDIDTENEQVAVSWENREQVAYTVLTGGELSGTNVVYAPGKGDNRKHPAVAVNEAGQVLLAWTEETGWQQGGSLHWQMFDEAGEPLSGAREIADGIPVWSRPAVFADANGDFTIVP